MIRYCVHGEDGQILKTGLAATAEMALAQGQGNPVIVGIGPEVSDLAYYIVNGEVVERPTLNPDVRKTEIRADGVDEAIIFDLPQPITLHIDDEPYTIEDGVLAFSTDEKGTYVIECRQFPYRDWRLEIIAR